MLFIVIKNKKYNFKIENIKSIKMKSECEQLISNLEQCLKNNKNIYSSYSYRKENSFNYSFYGKTYTCNKNPYDTYFIK